MASVNVRVGGAAFFLRALVPAFVCSCILHAFLIIAPSRLFSLANRNCNEGAASQSVPGSNGPPSTLRDRSRYVMELPAKPKVAGS
jgi:hypothetical protein